MVLLYACTQYLYCQHSYTYDVLENIRSPYSFLVTCFMQLKICIHTYMYKCTYHSCIMNFCKINKYTFKEQFCNYKCIRNVMSQI